MKVFVTGGAGFIGRHFVNELLKDGNDVIIFDNFSNSSEQKISDLLNSGAVLINGDITDFQSIVTALNDSDIVIHLASSINVVESIKSPEKTFKINVEGSRNLINACIKKKITKIIIASSAAIYGNSDKQPVLEDFLKKPLSPYGESKLKMENEIKKLAIKNKINYIFLRFFNIYGQGQSSEYAGVITKFFNKISHNSSLEIFGDGFKTRDFISITDTINAIKLAMKNIEGKKGECYNIGTGKGTTINQLAELMILLSGKNLSIVHSSPKKGEIDKSVASISLAKEELNYYPTVELKKGLEELFFKT